MNKKFLSFVLAAVLAVSLGSSSVFAYVDLGSAGAGISEGSDGVVMKVENSSFKDFAEKEKGNLVTVFGYAAGTMTYAVNQTSISFFDASGMKAGFSVAKGADGKLKYTLSAINLNGSDLSAMKACESEYKAAIANEKDSKKKQDLKDMGLLGYFLTKKLGVSEDALKTVKTDEDGNLLNAEGKRVSDSKDAATVYAAWLTQDIKKEDGKTVDNSNAAAWLGKGINFSISISLGGSEPTVTYSENGKNLYSLGSYAGGTYIATQNVYNDNGFCTDSISVSLKGTLDGDAMKYTKQYTHTVMDEFGRQSYSYEADSAGNNIGYKKEELDQDSLKDNKIEYKEVEGAEKVYGHTVDFHYSANGSLASYTDNKTGNTTHYVAGVASYVTNDRGAVVSQYTYNKGIMQMVQSFNDGTVVNTTVFDSFGRQLGTVNGNETYTTAVNAIKDYLKTGGGLGKQETAAKSIVQSASIYRDYLEDNSPYKNFITNHTGVTENHANKTYGYQSAVATTSVSTGDNGTVNIDTNEGEEKSIDLTKASKNKDGKYTIKVGKENVEITLMKDRHGRLKLSKEDATKLLKSVGIKDEDIDNYLQKASYDDNYLINLGKDDENAKKLGTKIFKNLGFAVSDSADFAIDAKGITGYCLAASFKGKTTTTTTATAAIQTTFAIQGVSVGQETNYMGEKTNESTTVNSASRIDPAVVGTVKEVVTIDGKQYAVLTNAQVDIADGNGFQSADGEEIYVCIDDLSDEEKAQLEPGKTFAAAGYIDTSADGHYAINNLYAHEISSSDVQNMVQSFATTLAGNAEYQANVQMNMVTFAKAAADGKTYQDWKGGWQLLVEYGGGAPALF